MGFLTFLVREGSSVIFSILIVLFVVATTALSLEHNYVSMFMITVVSLIYLSMQMALAAFAKVGEDRPMLDVFFSLLPLITLVVIAVLAVTGLMSLNLFHVLSLFVAGAVTVMDVVFNTQVVFKMNRLATDMVQMR